MAARASFLSWSDGREPFISPGSCRRTLLTTTRTGKEGDPLISYTSQPLNRLWLTWQMIYRLATIREYWSCFGESFGSIRADFSFRGRIQSMAPESRRSRLTGPGRTIVDVYGRASLFELAPHPGASFLLEFAGVSGSTADGLSATTSAYPYWP
jgi:hypothetical protein